MDNLPARLNIRSVCRNGPVTQLCALMLQLETEKHCSVGWSFALLASTRRLACAMRSPNIPEHRRCGDGIGSFQDAGYAKDAAAEWLQQAPHKSFSASKSTAGFDRLGRIVRTAGEVRQTRPEGSDQIQPGGEDFKEHVACRG